MIREELNSGLTVLNLMVHRYRKVYLAFPLYLLFLTVMFHLPKSWSPDLLLGFLMVPFGLGLLWTVFGFVNADADIASTDSAYSPWILRMPLKTRSLAIWPMLAATTWAIGSWLLLCFLCLQNRVSHIEVVWPALAIAAVALIFQAILWPPVKVGSLRMIFAMTLPMVVALFGIFAEQERWSAETISAIYGVVCLASATFGYVGLVRARTTPSNGKQKPTPVEEVSATAEIHHKHKAFRSPEAAQFWLEWRMQGRILPLLTILVLSVASVGLFIGRNDLDSSITSTYHKVNGVLIESDFSINLFLKLCLPLLPWVPLLLATLIGLGARPASLRSADGGYHLFHATRPLTSSQMYWAKMKSIGAGSLLASIATISVMVIWMFLPINGFRSTLQAPPTKTSFFVPQWETFVALETPGYSLPLLALLTITFILGTWRNQAVGACMDYVVSHRLAKLYPLAIVIISASIITVWETAEPLYNEPIGLWIVSGVLVSWIAAKGAVALFGLAKLRKLRPNESKRAVITIATWLASGSAAAFALGMIQHKIGIDAMGEHVFYVCLLHPVPELLGFVLVPVARPILARIALETGRHR